MAYKTFLRENYHICDKVDRKKIIDTMERYFDYIYDCSYEIADFDEFKREALKKFSIYLLCYIGERMRDFIKDYKPKRKRASKSKRNAQTE